MIVVDALRAAAAPWPGGRACHLVSDTSVYELQAFARQIGLPSSWYQARSVPHYDLSPRLRARAVARGAVPVDRRGLVAAVQRFRAANPELFRGA